MIGFDTTNLTVVCNTSAPVSSADLDYYEGYVSADNLNIKVKLGGYLSVRYDRECSGGLCYFRPAIINESSDQGLIFFTDLLIKIDLGVSLAFYATIEPTGKFFM